MTAPWRELFDRVADGIQTEAEERELAAALESSVEARREYRVFMELHSALHWDSTCLAQPPARPVSRPDTDGDVDGNRGPDPRPDTARLSPWPAAALATSLVPVMLLAAALVASLGIVSILAGRRGPTPVAAGRPPLAVIAKTRFLVPDAGTTPVAAGQPFAGGRLTLRDGAVELLLRNDVVLVVQGPAELDLIDELTAVLHDGTVVVRMPAGQQGFRVRTASTEVLDLGTEFAVSIGTGNTTDVQVYDGAVIASAGSSPRAARLPKRLVAGEAMRFHPEPLAEPVTMNFRPERFVRRLPDEPGVPYPGLADSRAAVADTRRLFGPAEHDGITVHRAPAGAAIDGRLDEWAAAPGFRGTRDGSPGCPEWADGRMMYDDTFLYIAAHVGDPLPLRSVVDPEVEAENGWQGGAVQVRVSTDRQMGWPAVGNGPSYYGNRNLEPSAEQKQLAKNPRLRHLTMWFHAATQTPCLTIHEGMLFADPQVNPAGFAGAFHADPDGKGYTLEYAIPWTLLGCADDPPRSGDVLAAVWQVLWADEAGRMRREQIVEVRNPDEPLRIHVWERAATWGRAEYR